MTTHVLASAVVLLTGVIWGGYWVPVRSIAERGLDGAWGTGAITLAATLVLVPFLLADRGLLRGKDPVGILSILLGGAAFALYSTGSVEVFGEIDGNLTARNLLIGNEGSVKGTLSAESIEVKGALDGRVSTQSFTLRGTAKVEADVNYTSLVIESGAQIEGRFTRPKS